MVNPIRGVKAFAEFFDDTVGAWRFPWRGKDDMLEVAVDAVTGYRARTMKNATESDATIAIAKDFFTAGERLTANSVRSAGRPLIQIPHEAEDFDAQVRRTVEVLNQVADAKQQPLLINAAGNGSYTLGGQDAADEFSMRLLRALLDAPDRRFEIGGIRSGGQTGYDTAMVKAALANGIRARIYAARGRNAGGFLIRRVDGRDVELDIQGYIDELDLYEDSIDAIVQRMRGIRPTSDARVGRLDPSDESQVFVFGSNLKGVHGAGAAKAAATNWGAQRGVGRGMTGRSYALPTKKRPSRDTRQLSMEELTQEFAELHRTVLDNPDKNFMLSPVGTGLGGYTRDEIAGIMSQFSWPENLKIVDVNDDAALDFVNLIREKSGTKRIELGRMTEAEVEQERRRIAVRTARVDPQSGAVDQIDAALAEESARALGITEAELARAAKEKNKVMRIRAAEEAKRRRALEGLGRGRGMGAASGDIRIEDIARAAPELLDKRTYLHIEEAKVAGEVDAALEAIAAESRLNFNPLTTAATSLPKEWKGTPLHEAMKAMDRAFPLQGSGVRAIDPDMFPDATQAELEWLADEGVRVARMLIRIISGDFVDNDAKKLMTRVVERGYKNLRRAQKNKQSKAIDELYDRLWDRAMRAESRYGSYNPRDFDPTIGREDVDAIWTGLEINPSSRIYTTLLDADGKPHKVGFRYDGTYDLTIMPSAIDIDGNPATIEQLEALLESNADFFDISDNPEGFWYFALGHKSRDSIARRFSNSNIRVKSNGQDLSLHEAFILDVLGWRKAGVTPGAGVQRFLLDLLSETKSFKDKKGNITLRRVARSKPLPLMSAERTTGQGTKEFGRPASEFYDQYKELILRSVDAEEFATLASTVGRRSLRSVSPLQSFDSRLTPEFALTDIMNASGLRPTAPKISRPRPAIAPENPDALPPVPAQGQEDVFHVYTAGEIADMPREMAESMLGVRRYEMPEEGLLNMLGIDRPYRDRIVSRQVKGRKPRPKRTVTETQRKGILEQKTPEDRELDKLKATDEYGLSLLEPETGTIDILRKPNTQRHFGNPYPIDDSENSAQRIWANQKFEHYFLHGDSVEAWNNAAGKSIIFNNARWMRRNFWRLRGKKLSCVCRGHYCHGEVLLRYAESPDVGLLIERFGDEPEILGDMLEEWLRRASAGNGSWAEHIQALESLLGDSLTAMPTDVRLRIQPGDLFMDKVIPKPGTPGGGGSTESLPVVAERVLE